MSLSLPLDNKAVLLEKKLLKHWDHLQQTGKPLIGDSSNKAHIKEVDEIFSAMKMETPNEIKRMLKNKSREAIEDACLKLIQTDPHIQMVCKQYGNDGSDTQKARNAGWFNPDVFGIYVPLANLQNCHSILNVIRSQAIVLLQQYMPQICTTLLSTWSMIASFVLSNGWLIFGINILAVAAFAASYLAMNDTRFLVLGSSFVGAAAGAAFGSAILPGIGTATGAALGWFMGLGIGVIAHKV